MIMKTYLINQVLTARGVEEIFINRDNKCWYLDKKIFFDGSAYGFDDDDDDASPSFSSPRRSEPN